MDSDVNVDRIVPCSDGEPVEAREYQMALVAIAVKRNIIAYLDTGTGKTLIAVLLTKHFTALPKTRPVQVVICLVPTTILVAQQAAVFKRHTDQRVGEYTGETGVDNWNTGAWREELTKNGVLVMTPRILYDALSKGYVAMSDIRLLIFDEAHHCRKKHDYAQIMTEHYHRAAPGDRPRVFGMTASPVNVAAKGTPETQKASMVAQILDLERNLDSQVTTIDDLTEVHQVVPVPSKEHLRYKAVGRLPAGSLLAVAWQTNLQSRVRLQLHLRYRDISHHVAKAEAARAKQQGGGQCMFVRRYDRFGSPGRLEQLSGWLGNGLNYSLLTQGPFCAALALKAWLSSHTNSGLVSGLGAEESRSELFTGHAGGGWAAGRLSKASDGLAVMQAKFEEALRDSGLRLGDVEDGDTVTHSCIFDAVHVLVQLIVCDLVLRDSLLATAQRVLLEKPRGAETHVSCLTAILDAALQSVPPRLLEDLMLSADDAPVLQHWRDAMTCDLFTPKVRALFQELNKHRDKAEDALRQVGALSLPRHLLKKQQIRRWMTQQQPRVTDKSVNRWAALVFTQRQSCATTLNELVHFMPALAHVLRTDVLMGQRRNLIADRQDRVLALFRTGHLNALFATSVAEEGLDVQHCSLVICYDVPSRPLSMVQTVGRARARDARVLFMEEIETGGPLGKQNRVSAMQDYLNNMRSLVRMRDALQAAHQLPSDAPQPELADADEEMLALADRLNRSRDTGVAFDHDSERYTVPGTNAVLTVSAATSLLHNYCGSMLSWRALVAAGWQREVAREFLQQDANADAMRIERSACQPRFVTQQTAEGFVSEVYMPQTSPVRYVQGKPARTVRAARALASFEVVKELHRLKQLDDHLRPVSLFERPEDSGPSGETWLQSRDLMDPVGEARWASIQTWRRPPELEVLQHTPLTLDHRFAAPWAPAVPAPAAASASGAPPPPESALKTCYLYSFTMTGTPSTGVRGGAASGAAPDGQQLDEFRMSLGVLMLQELPTLPAFDIFPDGGDAEDCIMASKCSLVPGGPVAVTPAELHKLQAYHTMLLRFLFRAPDQQTGRLVIVRFAVVNEHVKVALTPRRAIRALAGGAKMQETIDTMLEAVMPDYWNSEVLEARAQSRADAGGGPNEPVSDADWAMSSQDTWYVMVPVVNQAAARGEARPAASVPPRSRAASADAGGASVRLDWDAVVSMVDTGLVPFAQMFPEAFDVLCDETASQQRRHAVLTQLSSTLADRILVTKYNKRSQPYLFYGFLPDVTVLSPWPQPENPAGKADGGGEQLQQNGDGGGKRGRKRSERDHAKYATYQEYYEKRYGFADLRLHQPLLQARGFVLHARAINFLMPPTQGMRRREEKRAKQLQAISETLRATASDVDDPAAMSTLLASELCKGGVRFRDAPADAQPAADAPGPSRPTQTPSDPSVSSFSSNVRLVPQLCSVHPIKLSLWRSLQYLPSLIYRLQGLLVAHELRERLRPAWLPEADAPSAVKVLEAITHRSCADAIDFERYELLGDSFLKFAVVKHLYNEGADGAQSVASEGQMSLRMHKMVSNGTLYRAAWATRWLAVDPQMLRDGEDWHLRGVVQSLRLSPYRLNYWTPPGLHDRVQPFKKKILGKVVSDAMEALIGVFYEAIGDERTSSWLACLSFLPGAAHEPTAEASQRMELSRTIAADLAARTCTSTPMPFHGSVVTSGEGTSVYVPQSAFERDSVKRPTPAGEAAQDASRRSKEEAEAAERRLAEASRRAIRELEAARARRGGVRPPQLRLRFDGPEVARQKTELVACCGPSYMLTACNAHPAEGGGVRPSAHAARTLAETYQLQRSAAHVLECCRSATELASMPGSAAASLAFAPLPADKRRSASDILGYKCTKPELLRTACTHASFIQASESYDRLEFLGDAVLGLVVTSYIFYSLGADSTKSMDPGQLSDLRASITKNDCLAIMACIHGLHRCVHHSSPALFEAIEKFDREVQEKMELKSSNPLTRGMSDILYVITGCGMGYMGSMAAPKQLGDVLEALIGAVYVDAELDLNAVYPVVMRLLGQLEGVSPTTYPKHPVVILTRLCLRIGLAVKFCIIDELDAQGECLLFRGRGRIRGLWVSSVIYASTRRSVRTRIAEEVLLQLRHHPRWLEQITLDEGGYAVIKPPQTWREPGEVVEEPRAPGLKSLRELQGIVDEELNELRDAAERQRVERLKARRAKESSAFMALTSEEQKRLDRKHQQYMRDHPTLMQAAGTGQDVAPSAAVLASLNTGRHFSGPRAAGRDGPGALARHMQHRLRVCASGDDEDGDVDVPGDEDRVALERNAQRSAWTAAMRVVDQEARAIDRQLEEDDGVAVSDRDGVLLPHSEVMEAMEALEAT